MKKKIAIIISIILVVALLVAFVFVYVSSFKTDQEETLKLMEEVNEDYPTFNKNMTTFVNKRNEFYKQKEEIYLEEIGKNTSLWTNFMAEYAKILNDIEDSSARLKKACKNDFGDITAKSQCNQFRANYEAANNYYITDVKVYNEIVKTYNEWVDSNNSTYQKLSSVDLEIYEDYIDYDEDGEYFGKEGSK